MSRSAETAKDPAAAGYGARSYGNWDRFWFGVPNSPRDLALVKFLIGCIAAWYFCSHFRDADFWFGANGILSNHAIAGFLHDADLATEVQWKWSPLYWIDQASVIRIFLLAAAVCSGMAVLIASSCLMRSPRFAFTKLGGACWAAVWLSVVWLANRSLLISGPEELALSAATGYLALSHWTVCRSLMVRMLQIHACILLGAGGLEMLSAKEWWDGTGSVAVAAPEGRRFFHVADALSVPLIHETLSHFLVFFALASPVLIWTQRLRQVAMWGAIGWCVMIAILSSQWIYLPTLAAMFLAFRGRSACDGPSENSGYEGASLSV